MFVDGYTLRQKTCSSRHFNISILKAHPGPPTIFNEASLDAAQTLLAGMLGEVKAVWSLSRFSNIYPKIVRDKPAGPSILNGG